MDRNMTREQLYDDFNLNPAHYSGLAKKQKVNLPTLMNRLSPEGTPGYPQDAMGEMLARSGLEISGNATEASSSIEDFLDSDEKLGPKETMFWAVLEKDYDIATSVYDLERKMKLNADVASTTSDAPEGGAARPRSTRPLYELNKFRPALSITDLAGGIETIPGMTWQVPNYATPAQDEYSTTISEGGNIPMTTLSTSEETGRTKKVGAGLRVTREFELNATLMSEVRMWVRRQGMRDEIRIVNEGINLLRTNTSTATTLGADANLGRKTFQTITTHFSSGSGYIMDKIVGLKSAILRLDEVAAQAGNANFAAGSGVPPNFQGLYAPITIINRGVGPLEAAYVDDAHATNPNLGANLAVREIIGLDSRWALILYRQARGVTNENRYDPATQVREYFLTQRFGWHLQDSGALARFDWTT